VKTRRARERFCVAAVVCMAAFACVVQTAQAVFVPAQEASAFDPAVCETVALETSAVWFQDVGRQVLDPAGYMHPLSNSADVQIKALPAVPAAVIMTLFGFVCFSLGRDRRAWLAFAGGLLWLGAAGVHAVPQLAHRIRCRTVRQITENPSLSFCDSRTSEVSGRSEQIAYVGLLHKLAAIPDHVLTFNLNYNASQCASVLAEDVHSMACAITAGSPWRDMANECPASATGHFVNFSAGFMFQNLARGPPGFQLLKKA